MSSQPIFRESRRSTLVPLKVLIEVQDGAASLTGETVIVKLGRSPDLNLDGVERLYVYLTDKRAGAQVVHVDPENPMRCGVELDKPRNIWGVFLPPDDWEEAP